MHKAWISFVFVYVLDNFCINSLVKAFHFKNLRLCEVLISVIFFNSISSQCIITENKIADWVYFFVSKQEADLTTE